MNSEDAKVSEPRRWWIRDQEKSFGITSGPMFIAFESSDVEGVLIEVVEASALANAESEIENLKEKLRIAVGALESYVETQEALGGSFSCDEFKEALAQIRSTETKNQGE